MIYAITITIICLLISLRTTKNIFAPTTIISALWLFCIMAYWLYPNDLLTLKDKFYTGICLWVGLFTFSALIVQSIYVKANNTSEPNINVRNIYFIISIISFPLAVWNIYFLLNKFGINNSNIFYSLRKLAIGDVKGLDEGVSNNYFSTLWMITYAIELLHFKRKNIWKIIILLLINLSWALLVMAKMNFLSIILTTLIILFFKNIIKPKIIYISLAVIFVLFTAFQALRAPDRKKKVKEYDFFSLYVLSGMPAFEKIEPNSAHYFGESTFRVFYKIGHKIGLTENKGENALLPFTNIGKIKPQGTNVYTTLYPYYKDFGFPGIIIFGIIGGVFYGYMFKKITRKDNAMLITYSLLVTLFLTQFMAETTLSALSFIIQVIILSHLPYWSNNFVFKINESTSERMTV